MTQWVKREAQRIQKWMELDANYAVGQSRLKLHGWTTERRFVVIRERVRESRASVGRKLIDVPGYTFRIFVTNRNDAPDEIWQDYNRRADMENRIAELRHDLGANHFCLKQFHATEAAFRAVLFLFNLLSEFQRAAGLPGYREPGTIRTQILTCSAILGRSARRLVVHMGESWGGPKTSPPCSRVSCSGKTQLRRSWLPPCDADAKRASRPSRGRPQIALRGGQLRNLAILTIIVALQVSCIYTMNSDGLPTCFQSLSASSSSRRWLKPCLPNNHCVFRALSSIPPERPSPTAWLRYGPRPRLPSSPSLPIWQVSIT